MPPSANLPAPLGDAHPMLLRLVEARAILAESRSIDYCKTLRDQAEAVRVYVRQQQLGRDAEVYAAEIRVRAERRIGELTAALPTADPNTVRWQGSESHGGTKSQLLTDAGLSKQRTAEYERLAALADDTFEAKLREAAEDGEAVTTRGLLRVVGAPRSEAAVEVTTRPAKPWVEPEGEPDYPYICEGCGKAVRIQIVRMMGGGQALRWTPAEQQGQDWYSDDD